MVGTRKPPGWKARLAMVAVGTALGLGAAEVTVRAVAPQPSGPVRSSTPQLGLRLRPGEESRTVSREFDVVVRPNAAGYHDVDHDAVAAPGTWRVVVLGDSFVEAVQVALEDTACRLLEGELTGADPVEVINLGVAGSGTAAELLELRRSGLAYGPDLVLLVFAVTNDVYNNHHALEVKRDKPFYVLRDGMLEPYEPPAGEAAAAEEGDRGGGAGVWVARHSHLVRLVARAMALRRHTSAGSGVPVDFEVFAAEPDETWEEAWRITEALLAETRRTAEAAGARFAVVILPDRLQIDDDLWQIALDSYPPMAERAWDRRGPHRRLARICDDQGLECLDLLEPFTAREARGETLYFPVDGHLNEAGHRAMADEIAAFVRGRGLVPTAADAPP